jgi:formyl-CoA transferase
MVYCAATGFDQNGPDKDRPAFDDIIQAACGLASVNSLGRDRPDYISTLVADKTTGMALVNAVLAALLAKERSGQGQYVEVPMLETRVAFTLVEHMGGRTRNPATQPAATAACWAVGANPVRRATAISPCCPTPTRIGKVFSKTPGKRRWVKNWG